MTTVDPAGAQPVTAASPASLARVIEELSSSDRAMTFVTGDAVERLTYTELQERSGAVGASFAGLGVGIGDRVVLLLPSKAEFALCFLALVRIGAAPVPVFPPASINQIELSGKRLAAVTQSCTPSMVVTCPELREWAGSVTTAPVATYDEVCAASGTLPSLRQQPEDLAFLQYTSGSTAVPKGLAITHRNILANVAAITEAIDLGPEDSGVSWLPLYHDMGLIGFMLTPLVLQIDVVHLDTLDFVRRPALWLEWLSRARGTISYAPTFAYELAARRATPAQIAEWDLRAWKVAGCGAEPVRASALEAFAEKMAPAGFDPHALTASYGLAESTLLVSSGRPGEPLHAEWVSSAPLAATGSVHLVDGPTADQPAVQFASCGRPVLCDVAIRLDDGTVASVDADAAGPTAQGEILVRSASVSAGYWGDERASAEAFADGWLRTGDLGFVHGGELFVTGRVKDLVIRNGSKYHPQDIESAFASVAGLRPSQVAALSGPGEELIIALDCLPGVIDDQQAFDAGLRVHAEVGIMPDEVVYLGKGGIPKTSSGKPRRSELRAKLATWRPTHDLQEQPAAAGPG